MHAVRRRIHLQSIEEYLFVPDGPIMNLKWNADVAQFFEGVNKKKRLNSGQNGFAKIGQWLDTPDPDIMPLLWTKVDRTQTNEVGDWKDVVQKQGDL